MNFSGITSFTILQIISNVLRCVAMGAYEGLFGVLFGGAFGSSLYVEAVLGR